MAEKLTKAQREAVSAKLRARAVRDGDCLIWTGAASAKGYGYLCFEGRTIKTHRASFAAEVGDIPDGMMVCHRCDRPTCIEPTHLFLGTAQDNMRDAAAKGRLKTITSAQSHFRSGHAPRGERASGARLSAEQVAEIKARHSAGTKTKALADAYGVNRTTIQQIMRGQTWADAAGRTALQEQNHG